jgi:chromosomal replication initiator protein
MIEERITIARIQAIVAAHYSLPAEIMPAALRHRHASWPRQMAMMLSREFTPSSLANIARRFGGRDHTTVIHAKRAVEKRLDSDRQTREDLAAFRGYLNALREEASEGENCGSL